jgi:hypothetical protein
MAARFWTCQRIQNGVKCGHRNPKRLQICAKCRKRRPKTKGPAHRAVLEKVDYATCVAIFGEICGICGRKPPPGKKLHRDHDHRSGKLRGVLCPNCNRTLNNRVDNIEWLEQAIKYLLRASEQRLRLDRL